MTAMIETRRMLASELSWVNEQYAAADFVPSDASHLVVIAELDGARAAVGRIVEIDEHAGEMGGVYVLPRFRGQAVATAIVSFLLDQSPVERLFCIPFARLEQFYGRFGFVKVGDADQVPDALQEKLRWCQTHYPDPVCLLVRSSPSGRPARSV